MSCYNTGKEEMNPLFIGDRHINAREQSIRNCTPRYAHKRFEGYSVITALVHNVNNGNTEECIVLGHCSLVPRPPPF